MTTPLIKIFTYIFFCKTESVLFYCQYIYRSLSYTETIAKYNIIREKKHYQTHGRKL